jgi:hypothetical protein
MSSPAPQSPDLDLLLLAMEAALFGEVIEGASAEDRLQRIESVFTPRVEASDPVDQRINNLLTSIYFAPVVELPAPHGFAAFVPFTCVGVFPTKVRATRSGITFLGTGNTTNSAFESHKETVFPTDRPAYLYDMLNQPLSAPRR